MISGIDVSHWQDDKSTPQKMDFKKAKAAGAEFVFIKVSERGSIDLDFEFNWAAAKTAGLLRGGYHFLRWTLSGLTQARIFCDIMKEDPGELPPVADFEAPNYGNVYPSNSLLEQFLVKVEDITKRRPMIYTSPGYWNIHGRNKITKLFDPKWIYFPLWIAHYTKANKPTIPKPWKDWLFWQYSAKGDGLKYGAESKSIDLNWFNGELADLFALAGQGVVLPPDQPVHPNPPDISGRLFMLEQWAKGIGYK
jgi:lysozyme